MPEDRLPDAELEVLACVWRRGKQTAREIREAMAEYRPLAHASVMTLLKRLEQKGWVRRERGPVGKAFVYEAVRRAEPTRSRLLGQLVERVFGGSSVELVASLFESRPPDAAEVAELHELLERLEREAGTGEQTRKKKRAGRRSK